MSFSTFFELMEISDRALLSLLKCFSLHQGKMTPLELEHEVERVTPFYEEGSCCS